MFIIPCCPYVSHVARHHLCLRELVDRVGAERARGDLPSLQAPLHMTANVLEAEAVGHGAVDGEHVRDLEGVEAGWALELGLAQLL
jgi:hypothetical protein